MGQNHSTYNEFSHESLRNFEKHFKLLKDLNDPRFGLVQIFKEKTAGAPSEYVMLSTRLLNGEDELNEFHREVKLRSKLDHPNLLRIYGYHKEAKENLCGFTNKMTVYSEWHEHDLETELQRRAKHEEYLTEPELWYLADSTISAGAYLQERDVNHGDIRPLNVILSAEGYTKLADHGILNQIKNNYHKALSGEAKTYLAPELMRNFAKKKPTASYNVYKADVYSLGMSLLGAANLVNPLQCYDYTRREIRHDVISELLDRTASRYSPNFVTLLRRMVEEDAALRPDFLDLGRGVSSGFDPRPIQLPIAQQQSLPVVMNQTAPVLVSQPIQQPIQTIIGQPTAIYQSQPPVMMGSPFGQPAFVTGQPLHSSQLIGGPAAIQGSQLIFSPSRDVNVMNQQVFSPNKDLDRRVMEAIRTTEETIRRNSQLPGNK